MKKYALLVLVFFLSDSLLPNVAMPGFWEPGTARKFVHFFKDDARYAGLISMKKETITIGLYKDFAVVKGVYTMWNTSPDTIFIRTGFPISGTAENPQTPSVIFYDLYGMKVSVNGSEVTVHPLSEYLNNKPGIPPNPLRHPDSIYTGVMADAENWYVWENVYPPGQTIVTVYYLTDNSSGLIRKGYTTEKANGFSYIIESGASWHAPIGEGSVTVHFMDGLSADNIEAISPSEKFYFNGSGILQRTFTALHAAPSDNLLIRYTDSEPEPPINTILRDSAFYYAKADSLERAFTVIKNNAPLPSGTFEPSSSFFSTAAKTLLYLAGAIVLYFGFRYFTKDSK